MKCSFCAKEIPLGTGIKLFKRDGTLTAFDSRKCEHYARMGKQPRKLKWTNVHPSAAKK